MTIATELRAKRDKLSDEVYARRLTLIINAVGWGLMLVGLMADRSSSGWVVWVLMGLGFNLGSLYEDKRNLSRANTAWANAAIAEADEERRHAAS